MGVRFEPGDLVFFRHGTNDNETTSGGVVVDLDDGLLTMALPHGVEVWNMRSAAFGSAWRVEHTPRSMTEHEVLEYAESRLAALRRRPMVMVAPEDDAPFSHAEHAHHH